MSTRGCVAIGTPKAWRGVYNHFDSYPTGLGIDVWDLLLHEKDLNEFAERLLSFDDWRSYLSGGICEYCGKKTTQPHSISGNIYINKTIKHPDPECKYHQHDTYENIEEAHVTHLNADPLFIEWVYVIDPQKREFHILSGNFRAGCHELKGTYKLDSTEPDWERIKKF